MKASRDHQEFLNERLIEPAEAADYLNAMLADDDADDREDTAIRRALFMVALRDVAIARGITTVAKSAGVSRESLYRSLSKNGNPRLSGLMGVLDAVGLRLSVTNAASATHTIAARFDKSACENLLPFRKASTPGKWLPADEATEANVNEVSDAASSNAA